MDSLVLPNRSGNKKIDFPFPLPGNSPTDRHCCDSLRSIACECELQTLGRIDGRTYSVVPLAGPDHVLIAVGVSVRANLL
jgi:hypothetical protein